MANIFDRRMFDISRVRTYPEAKATPIENEGYEPEPAIRRAMAV